MFIMENTLKKKKAAVDFTTRPLLKKIIVFALPLILTSVLQLLYNAADLIVVGRWSGENAMAAVGSTTALIHLVTNLFLGLSVGALAVVARNIGARDDKRVEKGVHTAILMSVIGGIFVGAVGVVASTAMLRLMDTPAEILKLSSLYLRIYFCGMPFNLLYNFGASVLRACGDTKHPLIILIAAGVANIVLDIVTVTAFKMGVAGVGIATTAAQVVSAVGVVVVLMRRKDAAKLCLKKLRIHKAALVEIIKIGLPAGIQGTVFSLSNVIIQSSINGFGEVAVAANSAASSLEGFVYVSMNSISQACLTVAGQNYGAKKPKNIDLAVLQCAAIVTLTGLGMGGGVYAIGRPLLKVYGCTGETLTLGMGRLRVILLTYFLCGLMDVMVSALRAVGNSLIPMIISIVGICGFRITWVYTIFRLHKSLFSLYISYTLSWILTLAVESVFYLIVRSRKLARLCEDTPTGEAATDENVNREN